MKKIITAFAVLLSMTVSCFSAFAYQTEMPQDTDESQYKPAIEMCTMLNIMDISESMEFEGQTIITRADLARITMGMLNMKGLVTESGEVDLDAANGQIISDEWMGSSIEGVKEAIKVPLFSDVDIDHEDYVAIQFAADLGLMNGYGDGSFGPENSVTFQDMIKVIVTLLGYDRYAIDNGGYPNGYMYMAARLELTKYINLPYDSTVTKEQAASLVCEALEADLCNVENEIQQGKNLLSEYFNIGKTTGVVTATSRTGLYSYETDAGENLVKIGSEIYENNSKVAENMLGKRITAYFEFNDDGQNILLYVIEKEEDNTEVSFDYDDFDGYSNERIKYYEDGSSSSKNAKIEDSAPVIVNGVYEDIIRNIDFESFADYSTDMRILDSDNDGIYDVLFINSYKTYIVRSVNTVENRIFVSDVTDPQSSSAVITNSAATRYTPIELDDSNIVFRFFSDGVETTIASVKTDSVISVAESQNNGGLKYIDIYISSNKISGTVNSVNDNIITINDTEYRKVPNANLAELKDGYTGTLYLDVNGKVAAYSVDSTAYDYGVLLLCDESEDGNSAVFRIFRKSTGKTEVLNAAEKVVIDKKSCTPKEALTVLGGDAMPEQLVAYKVNDAGELREIVRATVYDNWNYSGIYDDSGSDMTIDRMDMGILSTYTDKNGVIGPGVRMERQCFRLFFSDFIPADDIMIFDLSSSDTSKWSVKTGTSNLQHNRIYDCAAYNISYCNVASIMVIFPPDVLVGTNVTDVDYYDKDCFIVSNVVTAVDEDDNIVKQITGFATGQQIVYTIDYNENKSKADSFDVGDVWQIEADASNRITAATEILDGKQDFTTIKKIRQPLKGKSQSVVYESTVGIIKEASSTAMVVGVDENTASSDYQYLTPGEKEGQSDASNHKLWITKLGVYGAGSTNLYWYDVEAQTVEPKNLSDMEPNDLVFVSSDYGVTRQILVIKNYD